MYVIITLLIHLPIKWVNVTTVRTLWLRLDTVPVAEAIVNTELRMRIVINEFWEEVIEYEPRIWRRARPESVNQPVHHGAV